MRVLLISADFGQGYELCPVNKRFARRYERETGNETVLIQTDWDFPRLAEGLGWDMRSVRGKRGARCEHRSTDGTVVCGECGLGAGAFIAAAQEWLDGRCDEHFCRPVEGYFGEDT